MRDILPPVHKFKFIANIYLLILIAFYTLSKYIFYHFYVFLECPHI